MISAAHIMSEAELPDRASIEEASPFYCQDSSRIGIRLDGKMMFDVVEYCVSQMWVRRMVKNQDGSPKKERGRFIALRYPGKVEPYWRNRTAFENFY